MWFALPKRARKRDIPTPPRIVPVRMRRKLFLSIVPPAILGMPFKKDWTNPVQGKSPYSQRFELATAELAHSPDISLLSEATSCNSRSDARQGRTRSATGAWQVSCIINGTTQVRAPLRGSARRQPESIPQGLCPADQRCDPLNAASFASEQGAFAPEQRSRPRGGADRHSPLCAALLRTQNRYCL